ncbi:MAG: class I SAM-dependent methyltransferase [Succinivibrio sp.]
MIENKESVTAKICSFVRAYHSLFADSKIFDDTLAYDLLEKEEFLNTARLISSNFSQAKEGADDDSFSALTVKKRLTELLSPIVLSRISWAENRLLQFAKKHQKIQYVIMGAGLDTFSFRNSNSNIEIFELDHPDTGRYKMAKIKELEWVIPSNVHFVPIDFNKDSLLEVLDKAGFKKDVPTFFSILGVTYYLTIDIFDNTLRLLDELSESTSEVVFDFPDESTFNTKDSRVLELSDITASLGETMRYGYSFSEIKDSLESHNFKVYEHLTPDEINSRYFEKRKDLLEAFSNVHYVSSVKAK